jgi:hypothetical protein
MIKSAIFQEISSYKPQNAASTHALTYTENTRTAGKIPVWNSKTPTLSSLQPLPENTETENFSKIFENTLTKAPQPDTTQNENFGFSDLLDMINPLQHIPIVNTLYRNLTGDTIKPIGKVIGGAAFGGPLGAVGGLASVIFDNEIYKNSQPPVATAFNPQNPPTDDTADSATQNTLLALTDLTQDIPLHMQANRYNS